MNLLLRAGTCLSQLTRELDDKVSYNFLIDSLILINNGKKDHIEETIRIIIEGININLIDSDGNDILTSI